MIKKPIALSFFSGAMGLDLGLEEAGFHVALASEIDKKCLETIKLNRPNLPLIEDILDYTPDEILAAAGLTRQDEVTLMAGGPPCQAFSTAGKRKGFEDKRGNVFLKYIDTILDIRPKYAVIENVRGLLSAPLKHRPHTLRTSDAPLTEEEQPGGALLHIIHRLEAAGYGVSFNLYNSANFGTPQVRERVVIICSRDGHKVPYLRPTHAPNGEYGLPKWKTFRDAVAGLKEDDMQAAKFPEARLRFYRMLTEGQYWKHLPEELQKEAMGKSFYSGGGKTGFLRRLAWDKPAPTLVTNPAMPATDLAHPVENRPLSIQEYARVQQFPDDWKFYGKVVDIYRQIGNAVPVGLGRAIGNAIINHMSGNIVNMSDFKFSRYVNTDDTSWRKSLKPAKQAVGAQGNLF